MKKLAILALPLASLPATALAQTARAPAPPYCFDLSRIVDLAVTKERFASIAGRPRPGDFRDTKLVLAGWKDCSLYGAATYTCDSAEMDTAQQADEARRETQAIAPVIARGRAWLPHSIAGVVGQAHRQFGYLPAISYTTFERA